MDVKHEKGGAMEVLLSDEDLKTLENGKPVETDEPTESGLRPFVVSETHQYSSNVDAGIYGEQLGIYIHASFLMLKSIRMAQESQVPLAVVPRNRISTIYESPTRAQDYFGSEGTITVNPPPLV